MTDRQRLVSKTETLSDSEITEVLDYISSLESLREPTSRPDLVDDDMVSWLSEAVENRRARVVAEWDKIRRRADNRAAGYAAGRK